LIQQDPYHELPQDLLWHMWLEPSTYNKPWTTQIWIGTQELKGCFLAHDTRDFIILVLASSHMDSLDLSSILYLPFVLNCFPTIVRKFWSLLQSIFILNYGNGGFTIFMRDHSISPLCMFWTLWPSRISKILQNMHSNKQLEAKANAGANKFVSGL
jgi:hypothetical protein